jgi:hypothetical protein
MPLGLGGFTYTLGDGFVGLGRFTLGLLWGRLAGLPKARCPRVVGHARRLDEGRFSLLRDRSAGCLELFFVRQLCAREKSSLFICGVQL